MQVRWAHAGWRSSAEALPLACSPVPAPPCAFLPVPTWALPFSSRQEIGNKVTRRFPPRSLTVNEPLGVRSPPGPEAPRPAVCG